MLLLYLGTYDRMPDSYMLDIWMLVSDIRDSVLQPLREAFFIRFESGPATLELRLAMRVLSLLSVDRMYTSAA